MKSSHFTIMIKILVIGFAVLILIFVAIVATRPAEFIVERRVRISAPQNVVFGQTNNLRHLNEWSPWMKMDPGTKVVYEGPEAGLGAAFNWKSKQTGEGKMTVIESKANELVRCSLEFKKPFEANHVATYKFRPVGDQTEVIWRMTGRNNFLFKAVNLFVSPDRMIGGNFEQGLASLKNLAETKR